MRTTRIVNSATVSAARKNCLTSTAAILTTIGTTPLTTRNSQQQESILFKEVPSISLDALKFRLSPINTDVRELENSSPNAFENSAAPSTKHKDHSPSRIAHHSTFKFDFRTLDERIADAKPRDVKQSRSVQLRS